MAIITIKDKDGNLIDIPAIRGEKGDKGDKGDSASATDVQINGVSVVDENGVANIPIANRNNVGLVKTDSYLGLTIENTTGNIGLYKCTNNHIDERNTSAFAINTTNYDRAVKNHLTDGKATEYTSAEKASARSRLGLEWKLVDTIEIIEEVSQVEIVFPQEYDEFMIIADISGNGNLVIHPYTCYNVNDNGVIQARQMLHSAYYPSDKAEHLELTFEKAYIDNDVYFRISGYEKTDYAWSLNKNIQTTGWTQAYDITNTKPCFAWYMVNFVRTITNATFKVYAR